MLLFTLVEPSASSRQFFKPPKSHPGVNYKMVCCKLTLLVIKHCYKYNQLILDFVHGYQLAGHVIWHGHF